MAEQLATRVTKTLNKLRKRGYLLRNTILSKKDQVSPRSFAAPRCNESTLFFFETRKCLKHFFGCGNEGCIRAGCEPQHHFGHNTLYCTVMGFGIESSEVGNKLDILVILRHQDQPIVFLGAAREPSSNSNSQFEWHIETREALTSLPSASRQVMYGIF